jgi:two-component system, response regulator PdtaR
VGRALRWRVAVLDDHARSRAELRAAVVAARGEIVGETERCAEVLTLMRRTRPDVAIFAVGLSDGDGIEMAAQVAEDCPVVLFTSHTAIDLIDRARAAGVMAFLLKPLRPAELTPALDLAVARFNEARELKQRLADRKIIERAKGALMERYALSENDAFHRLRRAAMDSRRPMVEVARALLMSESVAGDLPTA